ncbi:hypothetical protein BB561_005550 [Smittium simulii]|uniref:Uncharacterized protein n=1 Tax=Smittium simulii TaxID=133385 RepID=A0A2T9Y9T2_9FUNG|nr:hypothetical protein BB561_005550 [Smittium simulii]
MKNNLDFNYQCKDSSEWVKTNFQCDASDMAAKGIKDGYNSVSEFAQTGYNTVSSGIKSGIDAITDFFSSSDNKIPENKTKQNLEPTDKIKSTDAKPPIDFNDNIKQFPNIKDAVIEPPINVYGNTQRISEINLGANPHNPQIYDIALGKNAAPNQPANNVQIPDVVVEDWDALQETNNARNNPATGGNIANNNLSDTVEVEAVNESISESSANAVVENMAPATSTTLLASLGLVV